MDVVLTAISDCILRKLGILAISWPSQVLPERQAWSPANALPALPTTHIIFTHSQQQRLDPAAHARGGHTE